MTASYVEVAWDESMNLANWRIAMEWMQDRGDRIVLSPLSEYVGMLRIWVNSDGSMDKYIYICIVNVVIYTYVYMECVSTYVDIVRVLMCMYV